MIFTAEIIWCIDNPGDGASEDENDAHSSPSALAATVPITTLVTTTTQWQYQLAVARVPLKGIWQNICWLSTAG
jgi:hypothetical protein